MGGKMIHVHPLPLFSIEYPEFQFWDIGNPVDNAKIVLGPSTAGSYQTQSWVLEFVEPILTIPLGGWLRLWVIRGYGLRGVNFGVNLSLVAAKKYRL